MRSLLLKSGEGFYTRRLSASCDFTGLNKPYSTVRLLEWQTNSP